MPIDEEYLYTRAVQALSSSLHVQKTADSFFQFIAEYLPIKIINFGLVDEKYKRHFCLCSTSKAGTGIITTYAHNLPQQIALADQYNLFSAFKSHFIKNNTDKFAQIYDYTIIPFAFPCYILSCYKASIGFTAVAFCFEENAELSDEQFTLLEIMKLPLHLYITTHFEIWELAQKNESIFHERLFQYADYYNYQRVQHVWQQEGLKPLLNQVRQVAPLDVPILLCGATGSGKEVIAQSTHLLSSRRNMPFIAVNCGALPPSLIDSVLFGHEKGSFTGAHSKHIGYFEQANNGILFLDEIGELSLDAQVRLLRVLQEQTIQRVGGKDSIKLDFRLIAASHKDLKQLVNEGKFREDLFYRLSVITLHVPSLKERKQDIPMLARYFVSKHSKRLGIYETQIPYAEIEKMLVYDWPGNVRELENAVIEALAYSTDNTFIVRIPPAGSAQQSPGAAEVQFDAYHKMAKNHILKALALSKGKIQGKDSAAEYLGLNGSTLRKKMQKYGIKPLQG